MKKEIKILFLSVLIAAGLLMLSSCKSPMDIDTPYDDEPITSGNIIPNMTQPKFEENGELRNFYVSHASEASARIDTLSELPYVWMDFTFESANDKAINQNGLCIEGFSIFVDSLPIMPLIVDTLEKSESGSLSSFIIKKQDNTFDTLRSGMGKNITSVSFSLNKQRKEMFAFIYTALYLDVNQSTDTVYFKATLTFQY